MLTNNDRVSEIIGDWGWFQLRSVVLIYLCKIPAAWFLACFIYTAPALEPGEYFCHQPNNNNDWNNITQPYAVMQNSIDQCSTLYPINDLTNMSNVPCASFQFNSSFETTITKFSLVCSRSILVGVSQFFHMLGVLVGVVLAKKLMETISPRNLMLYGMLIQIISGCLAGLVCVYEIHILLRIVAAIACAQMFTAGQVIITDITGGTYRTCTICFYEIFRSLGIILLPAFAFIDPNWSSIYIMISLPTVLYIPIWSMIPDAPRWLLEKGEIDAAIEILQKASAVNSKHLGTNEIRQSLCAQITKVPKELSPAKWSSLWKDRQAILYIIAVHIAWAVYITSFNGMVLNVKAFGKEYLPVNTIAFGISEIVGVFLGFLLILKAKRKWQYSSVFSVFAGIFTSFGYFYPISISPNGKIGLFILTAIVLKIAVSCSCSIIFTCTTELVQPEQRKMLIISCFVWARVWLLIVPFIGDLTDLHPMFVFGVLSIIGGAVMFVISTPRTVEKKSRQTELPCDYVVGKIIENEKF